MIKHPEMTPQSVLDAMLNNSEHLPDRVGGGAPVSERVEAHEALRRMASESLTNIRTLCIACGIDTPLMESHPCVCGGFVCAACLRLEGEGTCDHMPPAMDDD